MRVTVAAVAAAVLLGGLAGCTSGEPRAGSAPTPTPAPGTDTGGPTPVTPPATARPPSTPRPTTGGGTGGGPTDDELPGPLPLPGRSITGTVMRFATCTVLVSGQRRWALTGPLVAKLKVGQRVTVTGSPTRVPDACAQREAFQALRVERTAPA